MPDEPRCARACQSVARAAPGRRSWQYSSGPIRAAVAGATAEAIRANPNLAAERFTCKAFIEEAPAAFALDHHVARSAAADAGRRGAFDQCSTSQPRLRAIAASRVSGLTATGKPTASNSGRSLDESA